MGRAYRFVQVDVFTDRVFGGNPLAVVFDADSLDDATMQAIAREMNLSETVFLLPPTRPEYAARLRRFTPAREVPFAGHPTIGTAWVLAAHGLLPPGARVAYESGASENAVAQQIWVRSGAIEVTVGKVTHKLGEDDCLAMQLDAPVTFHNRTRRTARYIVVLAS